MLSTLRIGGRVAVGSNTSAVGNDGRFPGGGGSGSVVDQGAAARAGGNGGAGTIIIEY
jgi:hypothetical protein